MTDAVDRHLESPEEHEWETHVTHELLELDAPRDRLLYALLTVSLASLAVLLWVAFR